MSTDAASRAATVGLGLAVLSAVSFGLSGPFAKALIDAGWSSAGAVLVRIGCSAVVVLLILAVTRPGVLAAVRADAPALLLYGLLAMAGVQVAFFNAVRYMPVSIALLLEYLGPVLVIAWVWVVRRQPPARRTLLGAGIAIVGLLMVVQIWSGTAIPPVGLAWGLAASVCQASYFLLADRAGSQTPPLVLAGVGMAVGTVVVAVLGAVGLLPLVLTTPDEVVLAGVDLGWVLTASLLVLVSTVLAYLTGIVAIRRIGAARGSLVALLEVVVSALAGWLLLGEVPAAIQLAGGALILVGVALTRPRPEVLPDTAP